jgi:two-component system, chemotaxis family, response regulator PixG
LSYNAVTTMLKDQSPQNLHPLRLLVQLGNLETTGCLQVLSGSITWLIYLVQGKLIYAWNSIDPFERLDRHLSQIDHQIIPSLSALQLRLLAETTIDQQFGLGSDYQTISWLFKQQYLSQSQTALLIENLAKEVLESLSIIKQSHYRLLEPDQTNQLPIFCQLEPQLLVQSCQANSHLSPLPLNHFSMSHHAVAQDRITDATCELPQNYQVRNGCNYTIAVENFPSLDSTHFATEIPHTIACVDDSPTFLKTIHFFLKDANFSVLMIADPLKALISLIQNQPSLILLDVDMPHLDGYGLCSLLRTHPLFQNTPVIMVTGYTGLFDRAKAKLVGASDYLTKPFTQSDLLKMMSKHLSSPTSIGQR